MIMPQVQDFSYEREVLSLPCNMTLTQSYETPRNLLIGMAYHRGNTLVTQRSYSYDTLARPLTRSTNRSGQTVNDSFGYNTRSELTSATVNGTPYGYDYDHIGNRTAAEEGEISTEYTANELNQYTAVGDFTPTFDAAGNQTLVKTATGIWSVEYNAENRPVRFTSADGATIIECSYDTMGRRATKKVTTNGNVALHQRFLYRGYLQIACCDLSRAAPPALWFITCVPTQPVATRPLAIRKDGTWFAYGWDLTKNICEVFGPAGYIRTAYSYSPYGSVTASGDVTQPIQWSSEYDDAELGLSYYNYRNYFAMDGKFLQRDKMSNEKNEKNKYSYVRNRPAFKIDMLGLQEDGWWKVIGDTWDWVFNKLPRHTTYYDGSPQSNSVKNSDIGKTIREYFLNKNKNCKTCKCWQGVYNYAYKFPTIKDVIILREAQKNLISYIIISNLEVGKTAKLHRDRFLHALFNSARASFIGSCDAQVTVQVMHNGKESYINASYQVMNTTSLKSLTAGILPDLEYDGPMGNWTQTYIWEELFSCCEDRTRQ